MSTFDFDQTVADMRDIFNTEQYPADDDMAVARYTTERALRAYGCPEDVVKQVGSLIYWASCNVARDAYSRAGGYKPIGLHDILAKAKESNEVAA